MLRLNLETYLLQCSSHAWWFANSLLQTEREHFYSNFRCLSSCHKERAERVSNSVINHKYIVLGKFAHPASHVVCTDTLHTITVVSVIHNGTRISMVTFLTICTADQFQFSMQPHQKYYITQYEQLGFSYLTQMKDEYTTNSQYLNLCIPFNLGECTI